MTLIFKRIFVLANSETFGQVACTLNILFDFCMNDDPENKSTYFIAKVQCNFTLLFILDGLSEYCFHPWCPDGRVSGGKTFVQALSQKP